MLDNLVHSVKSGNSADIRVVEFNNGQATQQLHRQIPPRGSQQVSEQDGQDLEAARPPYAHVMLAGGLGGLTGDMLMHSIDTVKTRQQGDPHVPPKYSTLRSSYWTIWRQEGIIRGLYSGVLPAFLGSFFGTTLFFGSYEYFKRLQIDQGISPWLAYFNAGIFADVVASPVYVPSEVLKTRLQLQGRFNNPYFKTGYNYPSTLSAICSIFKHEGFGALFYGYRATLYRDVPFSALQFAFYEQEQNLARAWLGTRDIGLPLEIATGASAGCLAGVITCPLDVVKTRIQTQVLPSPPAQSCSPPLNKFDPTSSHASSAAVRPSTVTAPQISSVFTALGAIYRSEGINGLFRGVGPRAVWTAVQSGTMLVLYQAILRYLDNHSLLYSASPS